MPVGNLEFIKSVNVSDGATSVDITDVFSAEYDVYKIISFCNSNSTTAMNCNGRLIDSGGSVISTSNYDYAYLQLNAYTSFVEGKNTSQNNLVALFGTTDLKPESSSSVTYVFNPFNSSYTFFTHQDMLSFNGNNLGRKYIGVLKETTSCTGFNSFVSASAFGGNTKFLVYGVK